MKCTIIINFFKWKFSKEFHYDVNKKPLRSKEKVLRFKEKIEK